mgnify:CR=1 FL=1
MVDEPSAMRGRLARLRGELADERPIVSGLGAEIAGLAGELARQAPDAAQLAVAAVRIHRYYTALESVLLRVERTFAAEPAGGDWHLDLLRGATRELPGIRLAVLPRAVLDPLHEVLRFRHFFRHAYAIALDGTKLAKVARHVVTVHADVDAALGAFDRFLAELSERMDEE